MALTRAEVDANLNGKGEFVQLDHLKRFLQKADNLDVKKYILLKLALINEGHGFFADAAKNLDSAADMAISSKEKIEIYMKEADLFVRVGQFDVADKIFQKAYSFGNLSEKEQCRQKYRNFYRAQAMAAEKDGKNRVALSYYERLYSTVSEYEKRNEIKKKLLQLYHRLGKIREYTHLSSQPDETPKQNIKPQIEAGSFEDLGIRKYWF